VATRAIVLNDEATDFRWVTRTDGPWLDAPPNVLQLARLALAAPRTS